jgi:adenylate cyclase, class 2
MVEHEVKLPFSSVEAARHAVATAGGRLDVSRRLVEDVLYDTPDRRLRQSGQTLRLRRDGAGAALTFKGQKQAGPVKSREELESRVGDAEVIDTLLRRLGFVAVFRSEKYRAEYLLGSAHVTIDDTPVGVFVEVEAGPEEIARVTGHLGRTPADYVLDSYPELWRRWCAARPNESGDMVFREARSS